MSVDVELHMNPEFGVDSVVSHLKSVGSEDVILDWPPDISPNFFVVVFKYKGENRVLNFHYRGGIFKSNLITLNLWGSAQEILEGMAEKFGGVLVPNDCEENAIIYDSAYYNDGDALFVHRWALSNGYIQGSEVKDIVEADRVFEEKIKNKIHRSL